MPAWLSPFPISAATRDQLQRAGYTGWNGGLNDLPADGVLLYDTPDRCFGLTPEMLSAGYQQLQQVATDRRVVAIWRLLDHEPVAGLIETAITFALIQVVPDLLEAYLDLELKADLLGSEPDIAYRRRLLSSMESEKLIKTWLEIQDQLVLASSGNLSAALKSNEEETAAAEAFQDQVTSLITAEQEAREEANLIQLQLHQVQEELEHYFLLSRGQSQQLERYNQLQRRSQQLLTKLAMRSLI